MTSINIASSIDVIQAPYSIILIVLAIQLTLFWLFKANNKNPKHEQKIRTANKIVKKLSGFDNNAAVICYLRQIDAYAFEEALLTAFEAKGHRIIRNKRYSGDGGIDGKVKIDSQWHFVQAKRYAGTVRSRDIEALSVLCKKHNTKGLFIHTGKTPKRYTPPSNVKIVSGSSLVSLVQVKKPTLDL